MVNMENINWYVYDVVFLHVTPVSVYIYDFQLFKGFFFRSFFI